MLSKAKTHTRKETSAALINPNDQWDYVYDLDGNKLKRRRIYGDSTATAQTYDEIEKAVADFSKSSLANPHSEGYRAAKESTESISFARDAVGKLVGYDPDKDMVVFRGNGATGAINYLAQALCPKELRLFNNPLVSKEAKDAVFKTLPPLEQAIVKKMQEKPIIITTEMEHHSNQLPWVGAAGELKVVPVDSKTGELDIEYLKKLLVKHKGKIRLVALSGTSNVTGIMNPIYDIAKLVHDAGAEICVDAAQLAPHRKIEKRGSGGQHLDYIAGSPHKIDGGAGTPGVLWANKSLVDGQAYDVETGGGIVGSVEKTKDGFKRTLIKDPAASQEPGTANIPGIIRAGLVASRLLHRMPEITKHEEKLTRYLIDKLATLENSGVEIIGSKDPKKRVGVVSFAVKGVKHPVVTAFLNDSWNISVRNGCFCAQPYVSSVAELNVSDKGGYIQQINDGNRSNLPGYVRFSLGEISEERDIDTLFEALTELVNNKDKVNNLYHEVDKAGNTSRKDNKELETIFSFEKEANKIATFDRSTPIMPSKPSTKIVTSEVVVSWKEKMGILAKRNTENPSESKKEPTPFRSRG